MRVVLRRSSGEFIPQHERTATLSVSERSTHDPADGGMVLANFSINGGDVLKVWALVNGYAAKVENFRLQAEKVICIMNRFYLGALRKRFSIAQGRRRSPIRCSEQHGQRMMISVPEPVY